MVRGDRPRAPFLEDPQRFNRELADFTRRVNQ